MVQDQLVEYISSQLKLGVSRDALKAALLGAGWSAVDVEETLNKVEGSAKASAPAVNPAAGAAAKPVQKPAYSEPQSIRVSDLVSASGSATPFSPSASPSPASSGMARQPEKTALKSQQVTAATTTQMAAQKKSSITIVIGAILIGLFAALAGFFFWQNMNLAGKVSSLGSQSAGVTSQLSSLSAQVQSLSASNTALAAQVNQLTVQNTALQNNLSFVAVPPGTAETSGSSPVTVAGTLTGGKLVYLLTTPYGVSVYVQNSKDSKVAAALLPLIGTTSTVTLSGTHAPGSQYLTVTAVNGKPL